MKSVTDVCKQFWNYQPIHVYNTKHWINTPEPPGIKRTYKNT